MNRFLPLVLALAFLLPGIALAETGAPPAPATSCGAPALFSAPNLTPNAPVDATKGTADLGDLFNSRIDEAGCFCGGIVCQGQFCWCQCVGDGRCCASCCRN